MKCCYLDKYCLPQNLFEHNFGFFWTHKFFGGRWLSWDTVYKYVEKNLCRWPERRDWDSMARGCKRSLSDFSHLHQPLEPQGVFLARWGWSKVPLEKFLLLGFTQEFSHLTLIIYHYLSQREFLLKKSRTRTAWMQPFSPRHFFRGPPPLFPICNNPALSLETHLHHQDLTF